MKRFWEWYLKNVHFSDLLSLGAAVISVVAIWLTLQQQWQKNAVVTNRLYFGSYTVGQKITDIGYQIKYETKNPTNADLKKKLDELVSPVEYSLGIKSALGTLTLADLPETDPEYLYFDAAATKYDDRRVINVFEIGRADSNLTFANNHKLLGELVTVSPNKKENWWTLEAQIINRDLADGNFKCDALDEKLTGSSMNELGNLTKCLFIQWGVSATPSPSPNPT